MSVYTIDHVSRRFGSRRRSTQALNDVTLSVKEHERWGIVGESGSGKTTLLKILAGLDSPSEGKVLFMGKCLDIRDRATLGDLRSSVQMVFQDPRSSLDPRMRVGDIISEPLRSPLVKGKVPADADARVAEVLDAVGLPADSQRLFAHEFSGGQRQRIALARALAPNPSILLADEPVSALDVSVRAHVLNLIDDLVDSMGLTLIMVTHDLAVVRHTCDHVGVLYQGTLVEAGPTAEVLNNPREEYTRTLLASTRLGHA
ncbi:MAG: ATP-binding cassette domain-containing protein [Propionibacteriaceae bacterium]|nr:ATP-binding cassette domain-containing protein [Propionibacteriaceae bacterium]